MAKCSRSDAGVGRLTAFGQVEKMAELLAGVGTFLAVLFLVPQIVRLVTRRDVRGLSPSWAAFGLVTNLAWVSYLASRALWPAITAPLLALVSYAITLRLIAARVTDRAWIRASVSYEALLLAIVSLWGWAGLGVALAVTPAIQLTPAVLAAFRSARPEGLSPLTWALMVVEALMWGGYGLLIADVALVGYGAITAFGSSLVLARSTTTRPRVAGSPALVEV
jgi:uncharacterized protein with PQ loop repeat